MASDTEAVEQLPDIAPELSALVKGLTPQKARFALWYFDPDRQGTQKAFAKELGVHETRLSIWKSEDWFVAIAKRWDTIYDVRFGEVVRVLFRKATDPDDFQQVQAARTLADLLGKFAPKKSELTVTTLEGFIAQARPVSPLELTEGEFRVEGEAAAPPHP